MEDSEKEALKIVVVEDSNLARKSIVDTLLEDTRKTCPKRLLRAVGFCGKQIWHAKISRDGDFENAVRLA